MKGAIWGLRRPAVGLALCMFISPSALAAKDPPQRFLVVMAASPAPRSDPQGYGVFDSARQRVVDLLFKPGFVVSGRPWYRFGIDTITMIESGPGPKPTESISAGKGHWNLIDFDYARPITRPSIKLRQTRFEQLLHPRNRFHEADPGLVIAASYRWWEPTTSANQLIHLVVMRESETRPEPILPSVRDHYQAIGRNYHLEAIQQTRFYYDPWVTFWVETGDLVVAPSPQISPSVPRVGRVGPLFQFLEKLLAGLALVGMAAWLSRWVWYQRNRARHFDLWIPGFARSFALPVLRDSSESHFRARLPRYSGEPALHLQLPSSTIRFLFFSRAVLHWDPRLQLDGLEPSILEQPLGRLPRFVRFLWVERPVEAGNLDVSIQRPRMLGGNDRMSISVSFLALPQSEPQS